MSDDYTPTVGLVRSAYVQAGMPTPEFLEATRNQMRQAEFDRFIGQVKAEALEELADHFATPRSVWRADDGVKVFKNAEHSHTWKVEPLPLVAFVRARAAEYRSGART